MVFRDYQFIVIQVKYLPECPDHSCVCCNTARKYDRLDHLPASCDIASEVTGEGKAQAGHDVVKWCGNLLVMDHIALGKHAASARNARRINRSQGHFPELPFDRDTYPFGLLVEEGTCPGGTDAVHLKIDEPGMTA